MESNRPELALLRGKRSETALARWVDAFGKGSGQRGARYAQAVETFLGRQEPRPGGAYAPYLGRLSPETRAAYAYAVTEFFEWLAREKGRVVHPEAVTRADAEDYAHWLATRPYSLEEEKLHDGDQPDRLAIYETVKGLGQATLERLRAALPAETRRRHPEREGNELAARLWLSEELGRMVLHDLLVRTPTIAELRREDPQIGISVWTVQTIQNGQRTAIALEDVFTYRLPKPRPVGRATIALRLNALAAFWDVLALGENAPGGAPLLEHNVFRTVLRRVHTGLTAEQRSRRLAKERLTPGLVRALIQTSAGTSLVALRDHALLWFLVLAGARSSEAVRIRREPPPPAERARASGWLDRLHEPPLVVLVRKGGHEQAIPFPPRALQALIAFEVELGKRAAPHGAQKREPREPGYLAPEAPGWRYRELLEPGAPLFPSLSHWGANAPGSYQALRPNARLPANKPMTRHGVAALLTRLAERAELSAEDRRKVHPHALRHFAAEAMGSSGKPIREIQYLLGHASLLTTEGYLPPAPLAALSGQAEILAFLGELEAPRPAPPRPRRRAVVDSHAVPSPEEAPAPARPAPAPEEPPAGPAESPEVLPTAVTVHEGREGAIVELGHEGVGPQALEIRNGISPGSPLWVYAALEPGAPETPEQLHFTRVKPRGLKDAFLPALYTKGDRAMVQDTTFLRKHYPAWPLNMGLGESSLLPWYARGAASKSGVVTIDTRGKKKVEVPPLPIFAPPQIYPETEGRRLFERIEALTAEWRVTAPTKVFGLRRWFGAFALVTAKLEKSTGRKHRWVPFDAPATVGEDIRAHDDDYLAAWLEKNADRYTTTVKAFEQIQRPRGDAYDEDEWNTFTEAFELASFEGAAPAEEIPAWFTEDDPVRAIYDRDPDEWEWFEKWIAAITGQKLGRVRESERDAKVAYAEDERETKIRQARALLEQYFDTVNLIAEAEREKDRDAVARYQLFLKGGSAEKVKALGLGRSAFVGLTEELRALGVEDPVTAADLPALTRDRTEVLVKRAFPDVEVELADPNVLRSALFDAEAFRIDPRERTIRHTEAFRERFRDRYDGRDSECILRRAARGMWEHVKRHGITVKKSAARASEYSLLYSVMLSYMAWTVPCPADMEKRMAATGRGAREEYLSAFNRSIAAMLRGGDDLDEQALLELATGEGLSPEDAALAMEALILRDTARAERAEAPEGHHRATILRRKKGERGVPYYATPEPTGELKPNAPPRRYLTPNMYRHGMELIANAEAALPDPLQLIRAMTMPF